MILVGNQRGGAKDLARHLLKEENDHVEVHELRGFASNTLAGALMESYAISRGTKAKQFLFSLSLNPPPKENVPTKDFECAIERVEKKLGLSGQPRAIVFHEKEGRRHAHAVWSRIDGERMKAIQMSHSGLKLLDVSRELYREHGWTMPRGLMDRSQCDPKNFTLEEWQQAKRVGRDTRDIKTAIQDAWAMSDSKAALTHALEERGFQLAKGDRRGFVAIDYTGEPYSLPRWADVKTKDVRQRIGDGSDLASVDEAKTQLATGMLAKMQGFQRDLNERAKREREAFQEKRQVLVEVQRSERAQFAARQQNRQNIENQERQDRFRRGLKGLWDRMRGEHRRIMEENLREAKQAALRDQSEKDALVFDQLSARRDLVKETKKERAQLKRDRQDIRRDEENYRNMLTEWRARAHPATGPTEEMKSRKSCRPRGSERVPESTDSAPQRERQDVSPLARAFDTAAKDERRQAFRERRAQSQERQRSPTRDR
ncbi:MAG: relaxase [Alphaproteobacteria bacterium]